MIMIHMNMRKRTEGLVCSKRLSVESDSQKHQIIDTAMCKVRHVENDWCQDFKWTCQMFLRSDQGLQRNDVNDGWWLTKHTSLAIRDQISVYLRFLGHGSNSRLVYFLQVKVPNESSALIRSRLSWTHHLHYSFHFSLSFGMRNTNKSLRE